MEELRSNPAPTAPKADSDETLREKYGKVYRLGMTVFEDDETEMELRYRFKRPSVASYDRYVKTVSQIGASKASKRFMLDAVVDEDAERLACRCGAVSRHRRRDRHQAHGHPGPDQRGKFEEALRERVAGIRGNAIETGLLEIYRFLPPPLLEDFDPEEVRDIGEFLDYVAKARVVQEMEKNILARAISEVFSP